MATRPTLPALPPAATPTPPVTVDGVNPSADFDAATPARPATRGVMVASYLLMASVLLLVMWRGLLPGLLCVCLGFLLTRALTRWFGALAARALRQPSATPATCTWPRSPPLRW